MLTFALPKDYSLPDDEVHIWQTRLDLPCHLSKDFEKSLASTNNKGLIDSISIVTESVI